VIAPALPEVTPQRSVRAEPAPARRAAPTESRTIQTEASAPVSRPAVETRTFTPARVDPAVTDATSVRPNIPLVDSAVSQQDAEPALAPAKAATEPSGAEALWVVGGVGGALLVGAGALLFLRRRDRGEDSRVTVADAPVLPQDPEPIFAAPGFAIAQPAPMAPAAIPAAVTTPGLARQAWSPAVAAPNPVLTRSEHSDDLETMVAQSPSPENPFLTRRKRLRRAEFLLHKDQASATFADTPEVREAEAPVKEKAAQPVYNFSSGPVSFRPHGWKPATA
jgi:hypothetical protein